MNDLLIKNGTVVDGSGGDRFIGDVSIKDGVITDVGSNLGQASRIIDADGLLVTPGFVDVHTHYDAQVTWANRITPSSCNGVTTVLMGNCGVGFAPVRDDHHDMLIELMEGVEDIPEVVMQAGLPWTWTSFPDYLDTLAQRQYDVDVATQVPHAALRVFVMGERGADREEATAADRAEMARLAAEGISAGAFGFSTSRLLQHRTAAGKPVPSYGASETELAEIADAVGQVGRGWLQVVGDHGDAIDREFGLLTRLAKRSGRPLTGEKRRPRPMARSAGADRGRQCRGPANYRPNSRTANQRVAGLRVVVESVSRLCRLAGIGAVGHGRPRCNSARSEFPGAPNRRAH